MLQWILQTESQLSLVTMLILLSCLYHFQTFYTLLGLFQNKSGVVTITAGLYSSVGVLAYLSIWCISLIAFEVSKPLPFNWRCNFVFFFVNSCLSFGRQHESFSALYKLKRVLLVCVQQTRCGLSRDSKLLWA